MKLFKFPLNNSYKASNGSKFGPFKETKINGETHAVCKITGWYFDKDGWAPGTYVSLELNEEPEKENKYKLSDFAIDSLTGMSKLAEVLEAWKDDLPEGFIKAVDECFKPVE